MSAQNNNSSATDRDINYAHWLIFGPISFPIAILGFIGNYLTLQTLHQSQLASANSAVFLKFLAASDAALIFFYFISFCIPVLASENVKDWMDNSGYYHVIYPLALIAQTCAVYTVVFFSIVRYIHICHPFGLHAFRTRRATRMMVSFIFAFAVICNLPRVFEHIPFRLRVFNASCNCTEKFVTTLGEQQLYIELYKSYGYTFGIFVIPVSIVCVLNARLGVLLHRVRHQFAEKRATRQPSNPLQSRPRGVVAKRSQISQVRSESCDNGSPQQSKNQMDSNESSGSQRGKIRLTHSRARVTGRLFCLVSVFITLQSLPMIDNLTQAFMSDLAKVMFANYELFYAICQFSVMLNSSINTVLYCFLGQRFRATFWKMIHRWQDGLHSFLALVSCQTCTWYK